MSHSAGEHARESLPLSALPPAGAQADAPQAHAPLQQPGSSLHCGVHDPAPDAERHLVGTNNSLSTPPKRRRMRTCADLRDKVGLSYAEVYALFGVPERTLRRMKAVGSVRRSVLQVGKRGVRFLRDELLEELRKGTS
jgi:hypothetical protein